MSAEQPTEPVVDPVVAQWKCRVPSCMNRVDVTQAGVDAHKMFNEELRRRGQPTIPEDRVMVCDSCKPLEMSRDRDRRLFK